MLGVTHSYNIASYLDRQQNGPSVVSVFSWVHDLEPRVYMYLWQTTAQDF